MAGGARGAIGAPRLAEAGVKGSKYRNVIRGGKREERRKTSVSRKGGGGGDGLSRAMA